jgi:NTP pyrophosphatase (non-canonical NTP hydrolase)
LLGIMEELRNALGQKANASNVTPSYHWRNLWTRDAILDNDLTEVKKELETWCCILFFYAKIGSETDDFDIADVCNEICEKLIHRHPHIWRYCCQGWRRSQTELGKTKT